MFPYPFQTPQELEEAIQQRIRDTDSLVPLSQQLHQAQRALERSGHGKVIAKLGAPVLPVLWPFTNYKWLKLGV